MDLFITLAVYLQVLMCSVMIVSFGECIFMLPLIGYTLLIEFVAHAVSAMMLITDEIIDEKANNDGKKQLFIPVVQKRSVWLICKALKIEAELAKNVDLKKEKIVPNPVPSVSTTRVCSLCKRLGMKAKLELPKNYKMATPNGIPTVYTKDVFLLCGALKIEAQMHA